jgi:glycosyltransferase involved in cell wall biosynthesis
MTDGWLSPSYEPGLVSVVIPCCNQERFLGACLKSIEDQNYRPIEAIIVNDGSSDGTRRIMEDFRSVSREGIEVKCLHQSQRGAQGARNEGCRQAKGEFIQFLDGDDVLCHEKLSGQIAVLNSSKGIDVVYGDGQYLVDIYGTPARKGRIISIGSCADMVESLLLGKWIPSFSYLSRRSSVDLCGPWDEEVRINQDFEYFLRMAIKGSLFRYEPGVTGLYRKHSLNTVSEQSMIIRAKTTRGILVRAEHCLRRKRAFGEQRISAMAEYHRRIARRIYTIDAQCFEASLKDVFRLCPQFRPKKVRARVISSVIGLNNYEKIAALVSTVIYKYKRGWF